MIIKEIEASLFKVLQQNLLNSVVFTWANEPILNITMVVTNEYKRN